MGGLEPCACSTRRTICASAVSAPTLVARKVNEPVVFMVAPMTSSPVLLDDRDRLAGEHRLVDRRGAAPRRRRRPGPSRRGARRRGRRRAPGRRARRSRTPPRRTRAVLGCRPMSALMAAPVCPLARASSSRPKQDQRDDERRRVEVHRLAEALVLEEGGEEDAEHAVEVGRRRAHGHQGVHRRRAVLAAPTRRSCRTASRPRTARCWPGPRGSSRCAASRAGT